MTPFDVADIARRAVLTKLQAAGRDVETTFVACGEIAWDDPCGMLVAAPERAYQSAIFPIPGSTDRCWPGSIIVDLVVVLLRCVPVVDDDGNPPDAEALNDAHKAILADSATVWNALHGLATANEWEAAGLTLTWAGAQGGAIACEARISVGIDAELFCINC